MRRDKIAVLKRWAEKHDAEFIREKTQASWNPDVEINTFRAVLERYDLNMTPDGMARRPKAFIEVNGYVDQYEIRGGDSLEITEETWTDPCEQDYESRTVESTGQTGGEVQIDNWGGLRFLETGEDGYRRAVTIEVVNDEA